MRTARLELGKLCLDLSLGHALRGEVVELLFGMGGETLEHVEVLLAELLRVIVERLDLVVDGGLLGQGFTNELARLRLGLMVDAVALDARVLLDLSSRCAGRI